MAAESLAAPLVLVDPAVGPAVAGTDGWNYAVSSQADVTGDTAVERVVLTALVEMHRGRPAWDDGQWWQVYVERADGTRDYLYAQRLQLGTLTMRLTAPPDGGRPSVLLIEHLPDRFRLIEVSGDSLGALRPALLAERLLDPTGPAAAPQLP